MNHCDTCGAPVVDEASRRVHYTGTKALDAFLDGDHQATEKRNR